MGNIWEKAKDAGQKAWDETEGFLSGDASDTLAFQQCTEAAVTVAQAAADIAAGVVAIYASGGAAAAAVLPQIAAGSKTFLIGMMTELASRTNKYLWAGYTLSMAQQGALTASVADPGSWYRVTHEGCGGGRNTNGSSQDKMGRAIGLYLGSPAIVDANHLSEASLASFFGTLKAQGMDGLEPVRAAILSGFKEATKGTSAGVGGSAPGKFGGKFGGPKGAGGGAPGPAAPAAPVDKAKAGWLAAAVGALFFLR